MIKCKICDEIFENIISWKHLKRHDMTTSDYKTQFGEDSLSSDEYRDARRQSMTGENNPNFGNNWSDDQKKSLSIKVTGRQAHNKGQKMSDEQKALLSEKAVERNKQWHASGNHPHVGTKRSDETRQKIKEKRATQIIKPESVQKAIETKKQNGYDLAFFRGKTHSDETKKKISEKSKVSGAVKHAASMAKTIENMAEQNIRVIESGGPFIVFHCDECNTDFTFSRQYAVAIGNRNREKNCPTCHPREIISSMAEKELYEWCVDVLDCDVLSNDRTLINPLELDIVVPSLKVAIEYCGLYWHSELNGKMRDYHLNKLELCEQAGYQLITIFEDEWINTKDIVKSKLQYIFQNINDTDCQASTVIDVLNFQTDPETNIVLVDRCWNVINFENFGYRVTNILEPNYWIAIPGELHRYRHDAISTNYGADEVYKIWDCGIIEYKYEKGPN